MLSALLWNQREHTGIPPHTSENLLILRKTTQHHPYKGSFSKEMETNHTRGNWCIKLSTTTIIKRYIRARWQLTGVFILNLTVRKKLLVAKPLLRYCSYLQESVISWSGDIFAQSLCSARQTACNSFEEGTLLYCFSKHAWIFFEKC